MDNTLYPQMKTIETEEFLLRPARLSDANDMYDYYKEDKVVKYLPFKSHNSVEETRRFINTFFIKNYRDGKIGHLAIVSKEDKKVIGNIGLNNIRVGDQLGEIGICINPKCWGDNLSTKLTVCTLMYGFEYLKMRKLVAITYEDNKYTRKSLQTLGFRYIKTYDKKIRTGHVKCHVFEIYKGDYLLYEKQGVYDKLISAKILD